MKKAVDCFRDGHSVRVWISSDMPFPGPRQAARLAALGLLFLRLRREYQGMIWEVLPGEMVCMIINNVHLVDPVRSSERKVESASLVLYPTIEEAKLNVPAGVLYLQILCS